MCWRSAISTTRKAYPSDATDAEWEFLIPYRTLMRDDAPQRDYPLRELFDALRYGVQTGCQWRFLPPDFPPGTAVSQQARRGVQAGLCEAIPHDLRAIVRFLADRDPEPTATILDGRTLQSTPESGGHAGYDGAQKKKGSKVPIAVDTLGRLLGLKVTAAKEVRAVTGGTVEIAVVDQGDTGPDAAQQAEAAGIKLEVVKPMEAKRGFVLLPRRWVVERSLGWRGRFRRLARDYARLAKTLAGWHWLAFIALLFAALSETL